MDSLEDTYQALRTFEILGIGKDLGISTSTCTLISETLKSTSASLKDVSFALKSNQILKCKVDGEDFKVIIPQEFLNFYKINLIRVLVVHCFLCRKNLNWTIFEVF